MTKRDGHESFNCVIKISAVQTLVVSLHGLKKQESDFARLFSVINNSAELTLPTPVPERRRKT